MKNFVSCTILLLLIIVPHLAIADDVHLSQYTLQVYEDGRPIEMYYVVDLDIRLLGKSIFINWKAVTIYVIGDKRGGMLFKAEGRNTVINAFFYSSEDGSVYDIQKRADGTIRFSLKTGSIGHWRVEYSRIGSDQSNIYARRILPAEKRGATSDVSQELRTVDAIKLPSVKILNHN